MTAATILLLLPFSHSHTGSGGESLTRSAPDSSRGVLGRMIFGCRATTCDESGHMLGTAILCALCSTLSSATLCGLLFRYLPPAISWHGVTPIKGVGPLPANRNISLWIASSLHRQQSVMKVHVEKFNSINSYTLVDWKCRK